MKIVFQIFQFVRDERIIEDDVVEFQSSGTDVVGGQSIGLNKEKRAGTDWIRTVLNDKFAFPLDDVDNFPELPQEAPRGIEIFRTVDAVEYRKREIPAEKVIGFVLSDLVHRCSEMNYGHAVGTGCSDVFAGKIVPAGQGSARQRAADPGTECARSVPVDYQKTLSCAAIA